MTINSYYDVGKSVEGSKELYFLWQDLRKFNFIICKLIFKTRMFLELPESIRCICPNTLWKLLLLSQWRYGPNRTLAFSILCLRPSRSFASHLQLLIFNMSWASLITLSQHLAFGLPAVCHNPDCLKNTFMTTCISSMRCTCSV